MNTETSTSKRKWPVRRTIWISVIIILITAATLIYSYLNRLLSDALLKSFNSTLVADVYELKFENLIVDVFEGSIQVYNVDLHLRERPRHDYPYINSSFRLTTENLTLKKVEIFTLLKSKKLHVERISITKPEIELTLTGKRNIMLPFKDSTTVQNQTTQKKESLSAFNLNEFELIDADFHIINDGKQREFKVNDFSISLTDLEVEQYLGKYQASFDRVALSIAEVSWDLQKGALQHVGFKDFKIGVDSLTVQLTLDTVIYRFRDFSTGLKDLNIRTADSLFHMEMKSFDLSYKEKNIKLANVNFSPNVGHDVLQKKFKFQHTEFSGSVSRLELNNVNFDSLIYSQKVFVDTLQLAGVKATLFKDKTKPMDTTKRPPYTAQRIGALPLPLEIKYIKATDVHLENTERKPDSTYATIHITRGNLVMTNVTNQSVMDELVISADAYINDVAHFKAKLGFSYRKPQFTFDCAVSKFNLPDLNPLIMAYTPAKFIAGVADEISFSGVAAETAATGKMKFLYHDLEIDLKLREQAKWKSSIITFAANSVLNESNPETENAPQRIVQFNIKRDMAKGFLNVLIKSLLNGLKETMIMSKENRKEYKAAKKKSQKDNR
jgi:hypothetical protein